MPGRLLGDLAGPAHETIAEVDPKTVPARDTNAPIRFPPRLGVRELDLHSFASSSMSGSMLHVPAQAPASAASPRGPVTPGEYVRRVACYLPVAGPLPSRRT